MEYKESKEVKSLSDQDKQSLAIGRWEHFKKSGAVTFTVGLDDESEFILTMVAGEKVPGIKKKMSASHPVPFTGDECLERVFYMMELVKDCYDKQKRIKEYLENL